MAKTCPFCRLIQPLLLSSTYDLAELVIGDPLIVEDDEDDEDETCLQSSLGRLGEPRSEWTATIFVDNGASTVRTPTIGALQIVAANCSRSPGYGRKTLLMECRR